MHLDPGRDTKRGNSGADRAAHITRRTITTGKQQQVDRQPGKPTRSSNGVLGCGLQRNLEWQQLRSETRLARSISPHLARTAMQLDLLRQRKQRAQCTHRTRMCAWLCTARSRLGDDCRTIAALEPHCTTDSGQRVHDKPEPENDTTLHITHGENPAASSSR
jgi:hypothetical protein